LIGYNYTTSQRGFFPLLLLHLYHEEPIYTQPFDHSFKELDYPAVMYEGGLAELASPHTISAVMKEFEDRMSMSVKSDVVVFVDEDGSAAEDDDGSISIKRADSLTRDGRNVVL
jgi:hypothetical protein